MDSLCFGVIESEGNMVDPELRTAEPSSSGWKSLDRSFDWIKNRERFVLLGGVAFQLAVLIVSISVSWSTWSYGRTILVRVVPVDPRDLLRGDYVILSYEFSRLEDWKIRGNKDSSLAPWYVILEPENDGSHWKKSYAKRDKPLSGMFLRGELNQQNRLEFGIESYFVQEGEGRKYEDAARQQKLSAEIVVDRFGSAIVKRLVIER